MFIQSQDDSHHCYSFFIKVIKLMLKLKYFICFGLDVHKNVIVATIVITSKDGISKYMITQAEVELYICIIPYYEFRSILT